jgi:hypothetical protein
VRHAHDHLAEGVGFQHCHEGGGRVGEAVDEFFAIAELAVAQPLPGLALEFGHFMKPIADDEALDAQPLAQGREQQRRHLVGADASFGRVVFRYRAADRDAREAVEQREDRVENGAADILEIDIDAVGAGGFERVGEILPLVIDGAVEAEFARDEIAFLRAARDADDAAAFELRDLARDRADRARGAGQTTVSPGFGWPISMRPT